MIETPPWIAPRPVAAHCVCKLVSVFTRPYTWEIEVWGTRGRHAGQKRRYTIPAIHEQAAAQLGMERFSREMALRIDARAIERAFS